jgi:hypothetical protein
LPLAFTGEHLLRSSSTLPELGSKTTEEVASASSPQVKATSATVSLPVIDMFCVRDEVRCAILSLVGRFEVDFTEQFPNTAGALASIVVDLDVVSLDGCNDAIETETEVKGDEKIHVSVRRSNASCSDIYFRRSVGFCDYCYSMVGRSSNFAGDAFELRTRATSRPSNYEEDTRGNSDTFFSLFLDFAKQSVMPILVNSVPVTIL